MRNFVHYDADYALADWKLIMHGKPMVSWRSLVIKLPDSIWQDDKKQTLIRRFLLDGFAHYDGGYLYCLSGGGVVLLFEGRASAWVEQLGRVLGAVDENLIKTMKLYDLSVEYDDWKRTTDLLVPITPQKNKTKSISDIVLSADKLLEIKKLRDNRSKPQVMIVEDDPFTRGLLTTLIQNKCDVISAGNMRQALSLYRQKLPDLVFLDIELPDGKGTQALQAITQADDDACVIMLSSHTEKANIVACLEHGAKGFVAKPFTRDRILHHIELTAERKRLHGTLDVT